MLFSNWVSSVTPKMNMTSLIGSSGTGCQHRHHQINHAAYTFSLLEAQHFFLSRRRNEIKMQVCSTRVQRKHVSSEENSNNSKISNHCLLPMHMSWEEKQWERGNPRTSNPEDWCRNPADFGGSWLLERISEVLFLQAFMFLCPLCCD